MILTLFLFLLQHFIVSFVLFLISFFRGTKNYELAVDFLLSYSNSLQMSCFVLARKLRRICRLDGGKIKRSAPSSSTTPAPASLLLAWNDVTSPGYPRGKRKSLNCNCRRRAIQKKERLKKGKV